MKVYNLNGKEIFAKDLDFHFTEIDMDEEQILLFNRNQMCVYSLAGVEKYLGDLKEGVIRCVLPLRTTCYMVVTEGGTYTIRLH